MRDFKYVKFNTGFDTKSGTSSATTGVYPLFGFAAADYLNYYNKTLDDIDAAKHIFGVIVDPDDMPDSIQTMIRALRIGEDHDTLLYVFDLYHVEDEVEYDKRVDAIRAVFTDEYRYGESFEELKDVYEGRVVFARKPHPTSVKQWN